MDFKGFLCFLKIDFKSASCIQNSKFSMTVEILHKGGAEIGVDDGKSARESLVA